MNYHGLVKRLNPPAEWLPPAELEYDDIRAAAISRGHLHYDVQVCADSVPAARRPARPITRPTACARSPATRSRS